MRTDILKYQRIRNLREDADISQETLAAFLNVKQSTYSRYEISSRTIPPEIWSKLADYFNTSIDYLMGRTDEKEPYPKPKNK